MTVSSTATRVAYTGNGLTTAFAFSWRFLATTEIKVYLGGVLQTTGYSVSAPGSSGMVTFNSAPANGAKIVIRRETALSQNIDYVANDAFAADVTEGGFDRAMLAAQDNAAAIGRALRVADHLPAINPIADPDAVVLSWATGVILATAYGVTADGVTDDTAAIVEAINAGASAGKAVWFPSGTIVCDTITMPSAVPLKGMGRTKTIFKRKAASANSYLIFASGISDLSFEGFSVDGNNAAQTVTGVGIRLLNCTRPVLRDIGAYGWKTNNAGAGITFEGGSGGIVDADCYVTDCYDGMVTIGHTDGRDMGATYTANLRNGLLIATASHGWRTEAVRASGNCLTASGGAGIQVIDSDDVVSVAPECSNNTLGHGYQHNNGARGELHSVEANSNGLSGVDWFQSPDGDLTGGVTKNNTSRGIEIDSTSPRTRVRGLTASGNGDVDISVFRSNDVELYGCEGNVKLWSNGGGALVNRCNIFGGGNGNTLTIVSGEAATVRLFGWQGSVVDAGNAIVATVAGTNGAMTVNTGSSNAAGVVVTGDGGTPEAILAAYVASANSPIVGVRHARGSLASPADLVAGDQMGRFFFGAYAGGAFRNVAGIQAQVGTGTISSTSCPSYLAFLTAADGSIARTERMRIDQDGNLGVGANIWLDSNRLFRLRAYTVATLPAAGTAGRRAYVTDASGPTFLTTVVGGGSVLTPVFDNGTNWVAG